MPTTVTEHEVQPRVRSCPMSNRGWNGPSRKCIIDTPMSNRSIRLLGAPEPSGFIRSSGIIQLDKHVAVSISPPPK